MMKYFKVDKKAFTRMHYRIDVSPFGARPCVCCNVVGCVDIECAMAS